MKLFELYATLGLDTAGFDSGIKSAIGSAGAVEDALGSLGKKSDETSKQGGKAASFFKSQWEDVKDSLKSVFTFSAGQLVAQGISSGMSALKQFAGESIELASSLNEVQNVIDVTFGTDAKKIDTWAKKAKTSVGMSELAAKKYVGTLGAMLKSSGLAGESVTELSMDMVTLAGDMASFYNLDYDTAFEKIRAGISGQTQPLQQLGINMSVANLEAFRLAQGIKKSYNEMSQSEQVELRMQYLAQAAARAAGDFERTATSYANARKTLDSNIDTLKADVGSYILPLVEDAINGVNALFEGDTSVSAKLKAIDEELQSDEVDSLFRVGAANELIASLEKMEGQTERTADEQAVWMSTLRKLVELVPDLSGVINLQTGEIEGGTKALRENTKAWENNKKAQAYNSAYSAREALADEALDAWANNAVEMEALRATMDASGYKADLQAYFRQLGYSDSEFESALYTYRRGDKGLSEATRWKTAWNLDYDAKQDMYQKAQQYYEWSQELASMEAADPELRASWEEATESLERFAQVREEALAGLGVDVTEGTDAFVEATFSVDDYSRAFENLAGIMGEVANYQQKVTDATRSQINSLMGEFRLMEEVDGFWGTDDKGKPKLYDIREDMKALQSQIEFVGHYSDYLEYLQMLGTVSDDLISYFASNITEENAERMRELLLSGSDKQKEYSDLWDQRNAGNNALTQQASDIQLAYDDTYQTALTAAEEMLAVFEGQAESYAQAMANNMTSMEAEISAALPDFQTQADTIRSALASAFDLSSVTVRWPSLSGLLGIGGGSRTGVDGSHADGLDYVPFDGYIAELHKGERVMTSMENYQYSTGQTGGAGSVSVDLSGLGPIVGSAVRDAIQGIGVYMNAEQVGHMVTDTVSRNISDTALAGRYAR